MKIALLWLVIFGVSITFPQYSVAFMIGSFFGIAWMAWYD